jgi:hypothetical protein
MFATDMIKPKNLPLRPRFDMKYGWHYPPGRAADIKLTLFIKLLPVLISKNFYSAWGESHIAFHEFVIVANTVIRSTNTASMSHVFVSWGT